jgi:hypothetical protein
LILENQKYKITLKVEQATSKYFLPYFARCHQPNLVPKFVVPLRVFAVVGGANQLLTLKAQKSVDTTKLFRNYFIEIQWDKSFIRRN